MALQRPRSPELEHDVGRTPNLGYEPPGTYGLVRFLEHGFPNPLVRWHYHEEYELHLIVSTRGKVFVGDYIGHFEPGHLVLTGPRLPHNWISTDVPEGGVPLRDMVLQFGDAPLRHAAAQIPELAEALPLLERARHGVEFFGLSAKAREHIERVREAHGLQRLAEFAALLDQLVRCSDYRLLSTVQLQSFDDDAGLARISGIVDFLTEHYAENFSMAALCARLDMTESSFSRYFRRATGNSYTDFVNRLRINKACQLLMETDRYITNVCYDVGFNNVANFNRRFLQIKGMTPKEFRRQAEARFGPGG
ncbi:AraC family transcriptional regulator [uncultured Piscinibacter sp.]|uniref:AraC family transcriptional regulator n=1 Tax=uncultured Piscinibacter sp. TaxID=1131835 RepID=UPI002632893A|nr:AraC family transcriptional regulator [uncultured Piscinibacter sp.]